MSAEKKTRNISDAERRRRSELAKKLHAEKIIDPETGLERSKFGGHQPGSGKTSGGTIMDTLMERLEEEGVQADVVDALIGALKTGQGVNAQLRAVKMIFDLVQAHKKSQLEELAMMEQMNRDQLLAQMADDLKALRDAGYDIEIGEVEELGADDRPAAIGTGSEDSSG